MNGNFHNFSHLNVNQFMDTGAFQDMRSDRWEGSIKLSSGTYKITWNQRDQAQVSRTDKHCCSWFTDLFSRGCAPTRANQLQTELNIRPSSERFPLLAPASFQSTDRFPHSDTKNSLSISIPLPKNQPARAERLPSPDIEIFTESSKGAANKVAYKGLSENSLPLHIPATRIRLRGDGKGNGHQELMITLENGKLVRISRNRGEDTFQYDAQERGKLMPTIEEYDVSLVGKGKTLGHVLDAFKREHEARPSYDHGNCQVLAKNIHKELTQFE